MATMLERSRMIFQGVFNRLPSSNAELGKWAQRLSGLTADEYAALDPVQQVRVLPLKVAQMFERDGRSYRRDMAALAAAEQAEQEFNAEIEQEDTP